MATILVVGVDPTIRSVPGRGLRLDGYATRRAADGQGALLLARTSALDLPGRAPPREQAPSRLWGDAQVGGTATEEHSGRRRARREAAGAPRLSQASGGAGCALREEG